MPCVVVKSQSAKGGRLLRLMDGIGIKAKVWGEILSSNGLLSDGRYTRL